jgi:hypothetical protein
MTMSYFLNLFLQTEAFSLSVFFILFMVNLTGVIFEGANLLTYE